ncbi:hypothetical protein VTJ83DRAFT_5655 [Remersonia thermophila]|uniref:CN hydrolase domain-containing protein n=1 Tax=Remersonia thermophila TaxID=72144 RepID=A0ABR4D7F2_9PEZI
MRIACLQFDPQVGDIDSNLDKADAILSAVHPDHLNALDLLVLPELAFTGCNFKSLQHIAPFLEDSESGISCLWAKTAALKYDCTVVVGYPEKVDVAAKWPASPEYYNSAYVVNGDGDPVANYRKSFLYYNDEIWALEGTDGFFNRTIPGLGNVVLGICTDINPYKLEAPWDAFEFGFHILHAQANLVILNMAWQAPQDAAHFLQNPFEPDLDALVYWVQRLEPLIRADSDEEVIVVFCNRSGTEGEVIYTGTSAVIGIKGGEVFIYGVLGRGVSDLLIVDTEQPPVSKLTEPDAKEPVQNSQDQHHRQPARPTAPETAIASGQGVIAEPTRPALQCIVPGIDPQPALPFHSPVRSPVSPHSPRQLNSPKLPWLAQGGPGEAPADSRSPTRLQIPTRPPIFDHYVAMDSAITDDVIIDTPAIADGPASAGGFHQHGRAGPASHQPVPASSPYPWRFPRRPSQFCNDGVQSSVFGAGAALTPVTPFDEDGWSATPIDPKMPPPWYWRHEPKLTALKESVVEEEEEEEEEVAGSIKKLSLRSTSGGQGVVSRGESDRLSKAENGPPKKEDHIEVPDRATPLERWVDLENTLGGMNKQESSRNELELDNARAFCETAPRYPHQTLSRWIAERRDSSQDDDNNSVRGELGLFRSREPSPRQEMATAQAQVHTVSLSGLEKSRTAPLNDSINSNNNTATITTNDYRPPSRDRSNEALHTAPTLTVNTTTTTPSLCSVGTSAASALSVATPDGYHDDDDDDFPDSDSGKDVNVSPRTVGKRSVLPGGAGKPGEPRSGCEDGECDGKYAAAGLGRSDDDEVGWDGKGAGRALGPEPAGPRSIGELRNPWRYSYPF